MSFVVGHFGSKACGCGQSPRFYSIAVSKGNFHHTINYQPLKGDSDMNDCLKEKLCRYIGQTVTIFTTSGGRSGSGFTGVLAAVSDNCVKLITDIGAPPNCPIGGPCAPCSQPYFGFGRGGGNCRNWLGSVTEIPICKIAGFTHNAI